MPIFRTRAEQRAYFPFGKRLSPSRVITAVAAAALVNACVGQPADQPLLEAARPSETARPFEQWLKESPRRISVSSDIAKLSLKKLSRETYSKPRRGIDLSCDNVKCVGATMEAIVALPLLLPLLIVALGKQEAERRQVIEKEEELDISDIKQPVKAIVKSLKDIDVVRSLTARLAALGNKNTKHRISVVSAGPSNEWGNPLSASEGRVDLLFKKVQLTSLQSDSREMRLQIAVWSKAQFQVEGVYCLSEGGPYAYESKGKKIDEWAEDNAKFFRKEVSTALAVISAQVAKSLFEHQQKQSTECDFYNSPAAINWVKRIRENLTPGVSKKKDVLALLGDGASESVGPSNEPELFYSFEEKIPGPVSDGFFARRYIKVILDKDRFVKTVSTNLDNETAIHRIQKIQPGITTREQAFHILGAPDSKVSNENGSRVRYEKRSWREWKFELLFSDQGTLEYKYVQWGPYPKLVDACQAARHKSVLAQEEISDLFRWAKSGSNDDLMKGYKWALIAKRYASDKQKSVYPNVALSKEEARLAEKNAAEWTLDSPCP